VLHRRSFLQATFATTVLNPALNAGQTGPPNIILITADDLGYGDLGCYGSNIPTPNLDQMASEGVLFEQFCSSSPVCSPSRAALLTGRYSTRVGVPSVISPTDTGGLSLSETLLPQVLKAKNYQTACVGKWHLGSNTAYLPTSRGFDSFYGLPYSNDMSPLPLMSNTDVIEQPANLSTLTQRYTDTALKFIAKAAGSPFFLYMPHTFPHIPLAASSPFQGQSGMGHYGDSVAELDWSVGQILSALKSYQLDQNTLVMFTSDHGPWYQGSAGRLRGRKGETYEGGVRVPFIARFPGRIPQINAARVFATKNQGRVVSTFATSLDIFPTLAALTGASLPSQPLDGVNIWPILSGQQLTVNRPPFLYFNDWNLQCSRVGSMKVHVARYNTFPWTPIPSEGRINLPLPHAELYDLDTDPQESYDISAANFNTVANMRAQMEAAIVTFPTQVQQAWSYTKSQSVGSCPEGSLPEPPGP